MFEMFKEYLLDLELVNRKEVDITLAFPEEFGLKKDHFIIKLEKDCYSYGDNEKSFKPLYEHVCKEIVKQASERDYFEKKPTEEDIQELMRNWYNLKYKLFAALIYGDEGFGSRCRIGIDHYGTLYVNEDDGCWSTLAYSGDYRERTKEDCLNEIRKLFNFSTSYAVDEDDVEWVYNSVIKGLNNITTAQIKKDFTKCDSHKRDCKVLMFDEESNICTIKDLMENKRNFKIHCTEDEKLTMSKLETEKCINALSYVCGTYDIIRYLAMGLYTLWYVDGTIQLRSKKNNMLIDIDGSDRMLDLMFNNSGEFDKGQDYKETQLMSAF